MVMKQFQMICVSPVNKHPLVAYNQSSSCAMCAVQTDVSCANIYVYAHETKCVQMRAVMNIYLTLTLNEIFDSLISYGAVPLNSVTSQSLNSVVCCLINEYLKKQLSLLDT